MRSQSRIPVAIGALLLGAGVMMVWMAQVTSSASESAGSARAGKCPVTMPPAGGMLANDVLQTPIYPQGTLVFRRGGAGFLLPDGSLRIKYGWMRLRSGQLSIAGRRLDAPAPPLRAEIPPGFGESGIQPAAMIFPTPGCWEVTGKLGAGSLTFVVRVINRFAEPEQDAR